MPAPIRHSCNLRQSAAYPRPGRDRASPANVATAVIVCGAVIRGAMEERSITVVTADDHFFFREGVRAFLAQQPGIRLLGTAEHGEEVLALVEQHRPDVLVTDVNMPVMDAHRLVPLVRRLCPATRIVILTISSEARDVIPLLEAGATGYLLKDDTGTALAETIRAVAADRAAITPAVAYLVRNRHPHTDTRIAQPGPSLTSREQDVLSLVARGHTNAEAATSLGLSVKTVEAYRTSLYRKLNVHNASELIITALRHHLIDF